MPAQRDRLIFTTQLTIPQEAMTTINGSTGYLKRAVPQNGRVTMKQYPTIRVKGQYSLQRHKAGETKALRIIGPQINNIIQSLRVQFLSYESGLDDQ